VEILIEWTNLKKHPAKPSDSESPEATG
jgi:hypothetical protein